jgi:hypothetical protein
MSVNMGSRRIAIAFFSSFFMVWLLCGVAVRSKDAGQRALDYMTEEEADRVREVQSIDLRIKVFVKIAERRLLLAEDSQSQYLKKDEIEWGRLPAVSRADGLKQYGRAIEEAIANFEDAYDRNPKDERLLKALTTFIEHTAGHLPRLEAMRSNTADASTRQVLERVLDDLKLAYDDAIQSQAQFKLEQEQRKKERKN